ncbi:hypothetical protein DFH94DRAFT_476781 [Russula ochroleuca]|uniref:Secreted protein n=1 Tax=Russula ochroleuca TaxID=152965 RepID=A0A9P5T9T5_9AGAM|nr:hypothetical protein DFH94DRAFT_476781 [Russula ochroleuca]
MRTRWAISLCLIHSNWLCFHSRNVIYRARRQASPTLSDSERAARSHPRTHIVLLTSVSRHVYKIVTAGMYNGTPLSSEPPRTCRLPIPSLHLRSELQVHAPHRTTRVTWVSTYGNRVNFPVCLFVTYCQPRGLGYVGICG